MTDFIENESDDQLRDRIANARRIAEERLNQSRQKYEGPITLTEGHLEPGVPCRGTFQLFNMQTGELHREGMWDGIYCGSEVADNGNLYHHFLEASVDNQFCGFFGQPAYRFQGKTEAPTMEWEERVEIVAHGLHWKANVESDYSWEENKADFLVDAEALLEGRDIQ